MASSRFHRWVTIAEVRIRLDNRIRGQVPNFGMNDLIGSLEQRCATNSNREPVGGHDQKIRWCTTPVAANNRYHFLMHFGDKDVSDPTFVDFETAATRVVPKADSEGATFSAHLVLEAQPNDNGNHLLLIERTNGISISSIQQYLRWSLKGDQFAKPYTNLSGEEKETHGVVDVLGYQSTSVGEAIRRGALQDVEFVKFNVGFGDGIDEDPIVKEEIISSKFDIKRSLPSAAAGTLFAQLSERYQEFRDGQDAKMLVRIKTPSGQIKQTEVDPDHGNVLESYFVQNEYIDGFDEELTQYYENARDDVLQKMVGIMAGLQNG